MKVYLYFRRRDEAMKAARKMASAPQLSVEIDEDTGLYVNVSCKKGVEVILGHGAASNPNFVLMFKAGYSLIHIDTELLHEVRVKGTTARSRRSH